MTTASRLRRVIALLAAVSWTAGAQKLPPIPRLIRDIRIDATQHDITSIGAAVPLPDGGIAFVEPKAFRLRFFDRSGNEIVKFGQRGSRIGEFDMVGVRIDPPQAPVDLGRIGDSVWAFNARRFTFLSPDGKLLRAIALPDKLPDPTIVPTRRPEPSPQRQLLTFQTRALLPDGAILGLASWGHVEAADAQRTRGVIDSGQGFAIASADGDVTRVVARLPDNLSFVQIDSAGLRLMATSIPFVEPPYVSIANDGSRIAFGETTIESPTSGTLRITVIGLGGDTLLTRVMPFTPDPISKRTADSAVALRMTAFRPTPGSKTPFARVTPAHADELEAKLRARMPLAASPYHGLTIGADHTLWISLPRGQDGARYLVLDEYAQPLRVIVAPIGSGVVTRVSTRSVVWMTQVDANRWPSLVRYHVPGSR